MIVNTDIKATKPQIKEICAKQVQCSDLDLLYTLYEINIYSVKRYVVCVNSGDDSDWYTVGNDREVSGRFFELLYENTVTPCTLCDVVDDYMKCECI